MASLILLHLVSHIMLLTFSSSGSAASAQKVKVELYYETLCPFCSNFMANSLPKIFQNKLINIIDLHLVPYGNAQLGGAEDETITCQHGTDECLLNTVEACAIYVWPDVNTYFGYVRCIETLAYMGRYAEWERCFKTEDMEYKALRDCYQGTKGKKLELQYAKETINLEPYHKFVPWLVVNGEPLKENYNDFMIVVCKAYKGDDVPEACNSLPRMQDIATNKKNRISQVCRVDVKTALTSPAKLRAA